MSPFKTMLVYLLTILLSASGADEAVQAKAKDASHLTKDEIKKPNQAELLTEALKAPSISSGTHKLAEGDVIEIKVYQEEELNTRARLDSEGTIAMPLLGLIKLHGKTVDEAQKLVRDLLEKDYLKTPEVSLTLLEMAKKRFSIVGEVNAPGYYQFPEGERLSIIQAVAIAGGFTTTARPGKVTIKRIIDGKERILEANLKAMAKKETTGVMEIQPGDAILVHQSLF